MPVGLLQAFIEIHPDGLDLFRGQSNAGSVCQRPPVTDGQLPNGSAPYQPNNFHHYCSRLFDISLSAIALAGLWIKLLLSFSRNLSSIPAKQFSSLLQQANCKGYGWSLVSPSQDFILTSYSLLKTLHCYNFTKTSPIWWREGCWWMVF